MRYITVSNIVEGMVLAQPLYGGKHGVLLGAGVTLSRQHVARINELGYAGVYVADDISQGIVAQDVVPMDLRVKTIQLTKEIINMVGNSDFERTGHKITQQRQQNIIVPILDAIIASPKRMVEVFDLKPFEDYSYYHIANVVVLSLLVGIEIGLSGTRLNELGLAALFHDVGSVFVPKGIMDKPGKLTPDEFQLMQQHTEKGFEYLRQYFDVSIEACMGALQHHEHFDGSGYPTGLKKEKISIFGRIIAVASVYDSLTSRRPFRQPLYPAAAMNYIELNSGRLFDPMVVDAFRMVIAQYPTGVCVELDDGSRCIVVENFARFPTRPLVRLLEDRAGVSINLATDPQYRRTSISQIIEYAR